jgi:hypothetical protein
VKQYGDELIPAIFNEKKISSESIKVWSWILVLIYFIVKLRFVYILE